MDENLPRRNNILNIILVGSIGMLVVLDSFVLLHSLQSGPAYRGISFEAFSALPAFFILLYVISRRGYFTLSSLLLIGAYFVSDSYAAYRWGVTMPTVLIVYALIIIMATILRGTKFGFFVTSLTAAFIIPVWYAQLHGILPVQTQIVQSTDAIIFSVLYFLIMIVAWLYDREIERSLRRAHSSEAALKEERDLLEVKVTERTEELRKIQLEKMQQLNRLAELGQLSSGLFHDLLNLLNALSLRGDDNTDSSLASAFNTAKQIEGFMQAVRKQIGNADAKELFSLTEGVGHAIQLVNYKANQENVRIIFSRNPEVDLLHFDAPYKFQEVVINLLFNAIESYEKLSLQDSRARRIEIAMEERSGKVILLVEDNGCGIPPEVQGKIFEPFFTTKDSQKGIGIGLATVKKIVEEDLGGTISVESTPGTGSAFTVTFSLNHGQPPHSHPPSSGSHPEPSIP